MTWLLTIIGSGIELWNKWFGAKNSPKVIESKQINDERTKQQKYEEDLKLAAAGDRDALDRVRAHISANP